MKGPTQAAVKAATSALNPKLQFLLLYLIIGGVALALYKGDADWRESAEVLRDCVIVTWIASLTNMLLGNGLGKIFGIRPRRLIGLLGIPFSPLLHRDIGHLIANTIPFLVLGWFILVQGELEGNSGFYVITVTILLIGGLGTWLFGRDAIHLGASGLVFGYIGFLLINGYQVQTLLTIGFAIIVFLMYGNQLWSMLPSSNENTVSWEGHLFGFIGGIVAGVRPDLLSSVSEALSRLLQ
ncbi:MAG: rhomboid family intramembrane serine protease [Leptolyngbya foveolarum]|uniref:Rhomboid family intramembrane serine protease n=1 Tax=Leptolyngbya foveolarum TaxID=47253 RepID=A0A2W4VVP8_9CYAN|nr:MAG: rhomboid family intramembrane serine protease [Leptolyngbya foveolarum]